MLEDLDTTALATPLALVARRLRVVGPSESADTFLHTSYLAEAAIKTLAVVLHAGIRDAATEVSYRLAYDLVRADGLGSWERAIREVSTVPLANFLPPEYRALLAWLTKRRTKPEDEWFVRARSAAGEVLADLDARPPDLERQLTVRELISILVQIRNKTKAHGAVGQDFFATVNSLFIDSVVAFVATCPAFTWRWLYLSKREKGSVRAVALRGDTPAYVPDRDVGPLTPTSPGVYVVPPDAFRSYYCGDLLRSTKECACFFLPNGGAGADHAEFIDYSTGLISPQSLEPFTRPPAPLPQSDTAGTSTIEVQSNVFGNLPELPRGYVQRPALQAQLERRLLDHNHHIITLHGAGGIGKTSLALNAAHTLSRNVAPPFESILWFSARDLDLRPTGPVAVRPSVIDIDQIAKAYGALVEHQGTTQAFSEALSTPQRDSPGTLFIFDNFETIRDVSGLYEFLDTYTRLPNKILITSRERSFKADYPIEVRGMDFGEAEEMIHTFARELSVEGLLTSTAVRNMFEYASGHPYIMRVMVGEIAKEGRLVSPPQAFGRRLDVADAVFERSFNKLTDSGRAVFLTVAGWRSPISDLALIVVLSQRNIDVGEGVDECQRLSLLQVDDTLTGYRLLTMPLIAREFAERKLQGDPDRLLILGDLEVIRKFGPMSGPGISPAAHEQQVQRFLAWALDVPSHGTSDEVANTERALLTLAEYWPKAWLHLGLFRKAIGSSSEDISYAYRRAIEALPDNKESWLARARFADSINDQDTRVASLIGAVDADPTDLETAREAALILCQYVNARTDTLPRARRGIYLASVRDHLRRLASKLDATGLSRLAWLYLLEEDQVNARKYATLGLSKEPSNEHCQRIIRRLDGSGQRAI